MREFLKVALVGVAFVAAASLFSGGSESPWLVERRGEIYPGDEIRVTYWVKGEEE